MALYRVTFREGSVQHIEADEVAKLPNMGRWVFSVGKDMVVAAFVERKVGNIEVLLDEESLEPRAGGI